MSALIALFLIVALLLLLAGGVWVGIAVLGVAWLAMAMFSSRPAGDALALTVWGAMSSWTLTALPLFIWMGEILMKTRLGEGLFRGLSPWLERIPGRLLHTNVIGCTIFAAVSGSSAATCAAVGKMTMPELLKRGYPEPIVLGSLAGAGTLGLLIPPSIMMIVYGVSTDVSIGKLFVAGVFPGIMLAGLFMLYIAIWSMLHPDQIPRAGEPMPLARKLAEGRHLIPVVALIALVMGSIYMGFATATEAASVGVVGALVLSALQGSLTWSNFVGALVSATRLYCMIALILAASAFLTLVMGYLGLPRELAQFISGLGLSPGGLLVLLLVFYLVLGCFLDGISMIVLTISVLLPTLQQAGIDLLWFGVFVVLVVEMAQVTPPVGFNLFVIQAMTKRELMPIAIAALPFFLLMVAATCILYWFPAVVTWLPAQMRASP